MLPHILGRLGRFGLELTAFLVDVNGIALL
jgi:hypothetical protein